MDQKSTSTGSPHTRQGTVARSHQGVALCFVVAVVCFETGSLLFASRQGLSILQAGLELVKIPCLSSLSSWILGMNYHI